MSEDKTIIKKDKRRLVIAITVVFLAGWFSFAYYQFINQILVIPLEGEVVGFEATTLALHQAKVDENVKAVILYLNTPGGGAFACIEIAKYVAEVSKIKPVIAVMGPTCASGGYYIASFATYVLTHSNTVTGGIGVIAVWVDMSKYYEEQGINITVWKTGPKKDIGADWRPPTEEEREMINSTVYSIFQILLNDIQQNRNLSQDTLDIVSQGGTYSGSDAVELGLADEIGDIVNAVEEAIKRTGMWKFIIISPEMDDKQRFLKAIL